MPKIKTIVRIDDPSRAHWEPVRTDKGFQLVSRTIPYPDRNLTSFATFVPSLDEAWRLISEENHGIRMGEPKARSGDYIYPKSLEPKWF